MAIALALETSDWLWNVFTDSVPLPSEADVFLHWSFEVEDDLGRSNHGSSSSFENPFCPDTEGVR